MRNNDLVWHRLHTWRGVVWIGSGLAFCALLLFYLGIHFGLMNVERINVEGEFFNLSTERIHTVVAAEIGTRPRIFSVDLARIRKAVLSEAWVQDVTVRRVWPNQLRLIILEQVPIARWEEHGLLTHEGKLFSPDLESWPSDLMSVRGIYPNPLHLAHQLLLVQNHLRDTTRQALRVVVNESGSMRLWLNNNTEVVLGRDALAERLVRLTEMALPELGAVGRSAIVIDLRYPDGFAVRFGNQYKVSGI